MEVSDIMTLGAATVIPESSLAEAIRCMGNHNISALPVVDRDGELHGLISEGDFFRKATDSFRSEEHTSELQSLMRISYAVFCLKKKNKTHRNRSIIYNELHTNH